MLEHDISATSLYVFRQATLSIDDGAPHLSKHLNDLKQNGTQDKTPFSGTVFNTLSHGGVRFVASGSSKNHLLTG